MGKHHYWLIFFPPHFSLVLQRGDKLFLFRFHKWFRLDLSFDRSLSPGFTLNVGRLRKYKHWDDNDHQSRNTKYKYKFRNRKYKHRDDNDHQSRHNLLILSSCCDEDDDHGNVNVSLMMMTMMTMMTTGHESGITELNPPLPEPLLVAVDPNFAG